MWKLQKLSAKFLCAAGNMGAEKTSNGEEAQGEQPEKVATNASFPKGTFKAH